MVLHSKYNPTSNKYAFYDSVDFIMDKAKVNEKVAELVDALALGASGVTRESSSLSFRTIFKLRKKLSGVN